MKKKREDLNGSPVFFVDNIKFPLIPRFLLSPGKQSSIYECYVNVLYKTTLNFNQNLCPNQYYSRNTL